MERTSYLIIIFLLLLANAKAQNTYKDLIYNAYIYNNMSEWKNIVDKMQKQTNKTNDQKLELLNYQYGYIAWCIGNDLDKIANSYLNDANKICEELEKVSYKVNVLNAYKSAFIGFEIGIDTYKAPFLGSKSLNYAEKSIENDKNNYFGYIQLGNIFQHMPKAMGGSKKLALEYYETAQKIMENNSSQIKNDWNYLNLLVLIAQVYTKLEMYNTAKTQYEKILKIEPNFTWVKNELLPEINKNLSN